MARQKPDAPEDRTFAPRDRLNSAEPCRRDHRIGLQPDRTPGPGEPGPARSPPQP